MKESISAQPLTITREQYGICVSTYTQGSEDNRKGKTKKCISRESGEDMEKEKQGNQEAEPHEAQGVL